MEYQLRPLPARQAEALPPAEEQEYIHRADPERPGQDLPGVVVSPLDFRPMPCPPVSSPSEVETHPQNAIQPPGRVVPRKTRDILRVGQAVIDEGIAPLLAPMEQQVWAALKRDPTLSIDELAKAIHASPKSISSQKWRLYVDLLAHLPASRRHEFVQSEDQKDANSAEAALNIPQKGSASRKVRLVAPSLAASGVDVTQTKPPVPPSIGSRILCPSPQKKADSFDRAWYKGELRALVTEVDKLIVDKQNIDPGESLSPLSLGILTGIRNGKTYNQMRQHPGPKTRISSVQLENLLNELLAQLPDDVRGVEYYRIRGEVAPKYRPTIYNDSVHMYMWKANELPQALRIVAGILVAHEMKPLSYLNPHLDNVYQTFIGAPGATRAEFGELLGVTVSRAAKLASIVLERLVERLPGPVRLPDSSLTKSDSELESTPLQKERVEDEIIQTSINALAARADVEPSAVRAFFDGQVKAFPPGTFDHLFILLGVQLNYPS